jgi:hypothetical protein
VRRYASTETQDVAWATRDDAAATRIDAQRSPDDSDAVEERTEQTALEELTKLGRDAR